MTTKNKSSLMLAIVLDENADREKYYVCNVVRES
jgi:hypothetical protein